MSVPVKISHLRLTQCQPNSDLKYSHHDIPANKEKKLNYNNSEHNSLSSGRIQAYNFHQLLSHLGGIQETLSEGLARC
jgi:hypothetical protein